MRSTLKKKKTQKIARSHHPEVLLPLSSSFIVIMLSSNSLFGLATILSILFANVCAFTGPVNRGLIQQNSETSLKSFNFNFDFFGNNKESQSKSKKTNVIAGATGYIGKSTVRESVRQGYNTIALVRDIKKVESPEGKALYGQFFEGAKLVEVDVCDVEALTKVCIKSLYYYVYSL